MDINKFEKEIYLYNLLEGKEKIEYEKKIEKAWGSIFDEYYNKCISDVELVNAKKEIDRIKAILKYDIKEDFAIYSYTANEGLGEGMEDDVYEYDKQYYNDCKKIAENIEQIKAEIRAKIEKFQKRKIMLFKKYEIEILEREMKEKERIANDFKSSHEKQEEKQYYLDNKETLLKPLEEKYEALTDAYAREVLEQYLMTNPEIIVRHNSSIVYSGHHKMSFTPKIVNEIFNETRNKIYAEVKKRAKENIKR